MKNTKDYSNETVETRLERIEDVLVKLVTDIGDANETVWWHNDLIKKLYEHLELDSTEH